MINLTELQSLVDRFEANIDFYKDTRNRLRPNFYDT